jgi:hypothetical protein
MHFVKLLSLSLVVTALSATMLLTRVHPGKHRKKWGKDATMVPELGTVVVGMADQGRRLPSVPSANPASSGPDGDSEQRGRRKWGGAAPEVQAVGTVVLSAMPVVAKIQGAPSPLPALAETVERTPLMALSGAAATVVPVSDSSEITPTTSSAPVDATAAPALTNAAIECAAAASTPASITAESADVVCSIVAMNQVPGVITCPKSARSTDFACVVLCSRNILSWQVLHCSSAPCAHGPRQDSDEEAEYAAILGTMCVVLQETESNAKNSGALCVCVCVCVLVLVLVLVMLLFVLFLSFSHMLRIPVSADIPTVPSSRVSEQFSSWIRSATGYAPLSPPPDPRQMTRQQTRTTTTTTTAFLRMCRTRRMWTRSLLRRASLTRCVCVCVFLVVQPNC